MQMFEVHRQIYFVCVRACARARARVFVCVCVCARSLARVLLMESVVIVLRIHFITNKLFDTQFECFGCVRLRLAFHRVFEYCRREKVVGAFSGVF